MKSPFYLSIVSRAMLMVLVFGLVLSLGLVNTTGTLAQDNPANFDVLFTLPVSPEGVQYAPDGDGVQQWGPKALAVALDGSFFISNTAANNILHVDTTGNLLNTFNLAAFAQGVTDLKSMPGEIVALDSSSYPQAILRLSHNGKLIARHELPVLEEYFLAATGLLVDETGAVFLEERGLIAAQVLDAQGRFVWNKAARPTLGGETIGVSNSGSITVGTRQLPLQTAGDLSGVRILGSSKQKTLYVLVSESVVDAQGALWVNDVIYHYALDGQFLGVSRFPLQEQFTYVDHPITVDHKGAVYGLLTRPDSIAVVRFRFATSFPAVLPGPAVERHQVQSDTVRVTSCNIYRSYISQNAYRYLSNSKNLTATNIDGNCSGREKPQYLSSPGIYSSVPYDWGGWVTVAGFNSSMDSGLQAGDINRTEESCSQGVDCSGFVTQAWGRTDQKYGTCTLPDISTSLPDKWSLREGDIMNRCEHHVFLIRAIDANGATVYESTTDENLDRVVYRRLPWSRFNGYQPRRYNGLCDP
ncbi:hypothetical protein [Roseiflexus sp.]